MEKILADHRHRFGDFEVVDFVDEKDLENLRSQIDVDAPVNVHWTWDYDGQVAELRRLYEKGKVNQWNAQTDLDWSIPVTKDDWVLRPEASMMAQLCKMMGKDEATQKAAAFDELAYTLSQLLHGEQAALQLCGQLTNVCDDMDQKWYAASQVIDEARHIEVMSKFVKEKLGTIYPIGGTLKVLLDKLLQAQGMQKKVLGMQTLFEGMAVGIMDTIRKE
ncbi:MAG: ferritin-like domain-containing protein, partial [Proteobacteria bacterium]|nr:ferritin-like domain-containing protein [Pseudomonadota bacterium]